MPGAALLAVSLLTSLPLGWLTTARSAGLESAPILTVQHVEAGDAPPLLANNWTDDEWRISIAPPA